jgi:MFS family permease
LTLKAGRGRSTARASRSAAEQPSPWRDLKEGLVYVWKTPHLLAIMSLAFMLNATAFPQFNSLLPYVAREIYLTDQTGLGYLAAGGAFGSLVGSVILSRYGGVFPAMRLVIFGCVGWYLFLFLFAYMPHHLAGVVVLFCAGVAQSTSQVPMAAVLLRTAGERFRGRVMGIRMLAIYGSIPGLLLAGQLIGAFGYRATASLYCVLGITVTVLIAWRWRTFLWRRDAAANAR